MMSLIGRLAAAQRASEAADLNGVRREALAALGSEPSDSGISDAAAWLQFATLLSKHQLYREAALLLIRGVRLQPKQPFLLQALGTLLVVTNQFEAAEKTLSLAVQLLPNLDSAWSSRGQALMKLLRFGAAIDSFERCQELRPLVSSELNLLAICLQKEGRLEEALACHDQALLQKPEDSQLQKNRALTMLTRKLTPDAWLAYEARFDAWERQGRFRLWARPLGEHWNGAGPWPQQLLVVGEQGLGDVLQFVRFVPLLLERVSKLQLCVPDKLMGLLRSSLPESVEVIAPDLLLLQPAVPWLALLSLPGLLEITEASCLTRHPYLKVGAERIAEWRARLCREGELLIGLHWQGNPLTEKSYLRGRSFPLEQLAPLAAIPGVRLLSLQRGSGAEQLAGCSFRSSFVADQDEISTVLDFEDTAAMVACCDVVVSSDSALAHLAGGLGVPTHLLLHPFSDWRWGLEREHCRWYSSMRLHRQRVDESWRAVVLRLASELARHHPPQQAAGWWRGAVITMDSASERFATFAEANTHLIKRLEPWQAVDGRRLDLTQVVVSGLYSEAGLQVKGLTAGTIGCAASHRRLWESCVISGTPMLILEDDVVTHLGLEGFIEGNRARLEACDIALFGCNTDSVLQARTAQGVTLTAVMQPAHPTREWITSALARTDPDHSTFLELSKACGLCCYWITPEGARFLLEHCFPLSEYTTFMPLLRRQLPSIAIDWKLCGLYARMNSLVVYPFLVFTPNADSSTREPSAVASK
jgi:GR25 family glycosyltransferase involved in LPS biosynthesis/tetratricopeptide (TPR) repeat protein